MQAFEYASPKTRDQAVHLLAGSWEQNAVLAGGTDLLSLMKDNVVAPKRVVNIKSIKELGGISHGANGLRVGALTTLGDIADNGQVQQHYPAFSQAVIEAAMKDAKVTRQVSAGEVADLTLVREAQKDLGIKGR